MKWRIRIEDPAGQWLASIETEAQYLPKQILLKLGVKRELKATLKTRDEHSAIYVANSTPKVGRLTAALNWKTPSMLGYSDEERSTSSDTAEGD